MMNYDEQKLKVNDALHRLELDIGGSIAFIEYKLVPQNLNQEATQIQFLKSGRSSVSHG